MLKRSVCLAMLTAGLVILNRESATLAAGVSGHYLETRTCQIYTGPCFANSETGLTGEDAVMAWSILDGTHDGIDLSGLKVVMAVHGDTTLGHGGLNDGQNMKSVIYVDRTASPDQQRALVQFAKSRTGPACESVVRISEATIEMTLDEIGLKGELTVGDDVRLVTRKAGRGDCICSNETAFYPPLTQVEYFAPGVTVVGEFRGRGLGVRWSTPGERSAYMATFSY